MNLFLDLHVVPTEMKTFCWESLYVEVNSFHCRLLLSNGQEINASLELGTFRVNDVGPDLSILFFLYLIRPLNASRNITEVLFYICSARKLHYLLEEVMVRLITCNLKWNSLS